MARVALIVPSVHQNLEGWIAGLQSLGHEVIVEAVRLSAKKSGAMTERLGVQVRTLPESPRSAALRHLLRARDKGRHWFFPERAVLAERLEGSDLIIARTYSVPLLITARSVLRRSETRFLVYEQHEPRPLRSWWRIRRDRQRSLAVLYGSLRLRLLGRFVADGVLSPVTQTPIETASDHPSVVPFAIVPLERATESTADSPAPGAPVPDLRVLMVARFEPRKRHDLAIDAVAALRSEGIQVRLHIVGQAFGPREEASRSTVLELVRTSAAADVITVETNLDADGVAERSAQSDVMVLPAKREPASIAVVEAAARGLPVVLARTCGTACYVQDGRTGFHVDEGSLDQLVATLRLIANDRELLRSMSAEARRHVASMTDPQAVGRRILEA